MGRCPKRAILAAGLFAPALFFLIPPLVPAQTKTGDVSLGTRYIFTFPDIQGEIPVRIHLPAHREDKNGPPPALYVLEIADDFVYASAVADFLARCGRIPGLVVVGIDVDKVSGPPQGMIGFLDKELIPFVEKATGAGPRRIVFGHSGRSFAALYMLLERPDLFEGYICPGLGLTWPLEKGRLDFTALAEQRFAKTTTLPKSFIFSLGDEDKFFAGIERFTAMLKAKAPADLRWKYLQLPGEDHESTKLKTLYQGLEFVLGDRSEPGAIDGRWFGEADIRTEDGSSNRLGLIGSFKAAQDRLTGSIGPSPDTQFAIEDGRVEGRTVTFRAAMPTRIYTFSLSIDGAGRLAGDLASLDGHVSGRLSLSKQKPGGEK